MLLFSCSVVSDFCDPHGIQHTRLPHPPQSSRVCQNSCPLRQWCQSTTSSSAAHFSSCPQSFPTSGSFPISRLFTSRWPEYQSFSISPSNEYSGLISFRIDWFDLLAVRGTLKTLLQRHSSKASSLQCSAFSMVQLSHPYMTTGKTVLWLYGHLLAKWCLCFLMC